MCIRDRVAAGGQAGVLTLDNLDWITGKLLDAQSADRLRLPGLKEDRRSIIAGGISILRAIFDLLRIDKMHTAQGGLRHGLLSDMVGEAGKHFDVRTASVARLMGKFSVDTAHSARVETVATTLFAQLSHCLLYTSICLPTANGARPWAWPHVRGSPILAGIRSWARSSASIPAPFAM